MRIENFSHGAIEDRLQARSTRAGADLIVAGRLSSASTGKDARRHHAYSVGAHAAADFHVALMFLRLSGNLQRSAAVRERAAAWAGAGARLQRADFVEAVGGLLFRPLA